MPIDKKEILTRVENLEKEDVGAKDSRKDKKKFWKEHSLEESLYNTIDGKRMPRVQDVNQMSYSHLNYVLKNYGIGDCYLLTVLMGLAKNRPNFIKDLIKIKNKDLVEVGIFNIKLPPLVKLKDDSMSVTIQPEGQRIFYSVSKDEVIKWKTSHKALWVVVVEIAYAKYLKESNCYIQVTSSILKEQTIQRILEFGKKCGMSDDDIAHDINLLRNRKIPDEWLNKDETLRETLNSGYPSVTLTNLTGAVSKYRSFADIPNKSSWIKKIGVNIPENAKPENAKPEYAKPEYPKSVTSIYDKLEKKCAARKIVTASFKGTATKVDKNTIASQIISFARELKSNVEKTIQFLEENGMVRQSEYDKWLEDHKLDLSGLSQSKESVRKEFVVDLVDFEERGKISKNSSGIFSDHAYLVLGVLEHKGYKYVILKNPHGVETKIDYYNKRKNKIPKEVELPSQIDKEKNECMMELNHFYKKLLTLNYDK